VFLAENPKIQLNMENIIPVLPCNQGVSSSMSMIDTNVSFSLFTPFTRTTSSLFSIPCCCSVISPRNAACSLCFLNAYGKLSAVANYCQDDVAQKVLNISDNDWTRGRWNQIIDLVYHLLLNELSSVDVVLFGVKFQ
jgi:hypothetical protein